MESGKLLQNPRALPPAASSTTIGFSNKMMSNEQTQQKPLPPIADKFRVLMKEREEELRASGGELGTEDVVQLYEMFLSDLTFNSKPVITDLTIIAGDQRLHGEGVADAICARIVEVPVEQKLPSLYLLDSIVKNIGREYIKYFSSRLPEVFCAAYKQVNPNMYSAMRHLFGTWSSVFPPHVLRKIESQLQFSSQVNKQPAGANSLRASESPRPAHGIHVNPKYIRQLDQPVPDNNLQHVRGTSSNIKLYGQQPSIGFDDLDSDHPEITSSQAGPQRLNPTGTVGRSSFALGANKLHPSSSSRLGRPISPSGIGSSEVDEFFVGSPARRIGGASPSHPAFDYGLGRKITQDEEVNEWGRKHYLDNKRNRFETSFNLGNGHEHQGPRALIDAYGNDKRASNNKPLPVEHLGINGIGKRAPPPRSWQNTEEEEFDWEDMNPTLAERDRKNDFLSSTVPPFGNIGRRPDFRKLNAAPLDFDIRSNLSNHAQLPLVDDSTIITEDTAPMGSDRGFTGKLSGFQSEPDQVLGSHFPPEAWKAFPGLPRSSHTLNVRGKWRDFLTPFTGSAHEKVAPFVDKLQDADAQSVRPPAVVSRIGSSGLDSASAVAGPPTVPSSTGAWPPVNMHSHPPPPHSVYPLQKQTRNQFDSMNPSGNFGNQGPNKLLYKPDQQFSNPEMKEPSLMKQPQLRDQHSSQIQQNQVQGRFIPHNVRAPGPPHLLPSSVNPGYIPQGSGNMSVFPPSSLSSGQLPLQIPNIPNSSLNLPGGALPPLPPGPRPASAHMMPVPQSGGSVIPGQPPGSGFSGLINSLMAQGLISLSNQTPAEEPVGLEFNADLLKVRHESAISALYGNLPRQCTTCGLRFKCQEEHSSHMDWHVTKNRMSKSRKQKPSRKWFVSTSMWLSGAEALGTEAVPGFLPAETVVEKKDDEEMAVPADEDQNACALCGEPFDDFYSDETEEWMYKGAVYMNAPDGATVGMDRSLLGPIVHAKCRSESTVVPPENFRQDEGGNSEEGSQRKRLKS